MSINIGVLVYILYKNVLNFIRIHVVPQQRVRYFLPSGTPYYDNREDGSPT